MITIPARVEKKVANKIGIKISVGCAAPNCARYTMILTGINVSPEVFRTKNIIMGLVAVSFFGLSVCNCSMALSPNGVAALSSPNMLAAIFIKILPVTGCPLGMSGKSLVNTGESMRDKTAITPPFSPIFMMPSHNDNTPVKPKEISKAVFDESKVEFIIAGKTSMSPMKIIFNKAITKAMMKNATQI